MRLCRSITVPTVAKPFYQQSMPAFRQRCLAKAGTKAASHTFARLGFVCLASQATGGLWLHQPQVAKLGRGGLRLLLFPIRPLHWLRLNLGKAEPFRQKQRANSSIFKSNVLHAWQKYFLCRERIPTNFCLALSLPCFLYSYGQLALANLGEPTSFLGGGQAL